MPLDLKHIKSLLELISFNDIKPDTSFFNVILNTYIEAKLYDSTKEILSMMQFHKISPDIITFGTLAKSIGQNTYGKKRVKEIISFLKDIDKAEIDPNMKIFIPLFKVSFRLYDTLSTSFLISELEKRNLRPNEYLVKRLENQRQNIRQHLKLYEKRSTKTKKEIDHIYKLNAYLKEYNNYLKRSKIEIEPHLWDQYKMDHENLNFEKLLY